MMDDDDNVDVVDVSRIWTDYFTTQNQDQSNVCGPLQKYGQKRQCVGTCNAWIIIASESSHVHWAH
jgi:hypothetical protein